MYCFCCTLRFHVVLVYYVCSRIISILAPNTITVCAPARYKCYSCEPPDCLHEPVSSSHMCQNAVQCWKSRVRDGDGVERVSRGCTNSHEQLPVHCRQNTPSGSGGNGPQKRHTFGQYNIECCTGDYCNDGDFPELPPIVYSECGRNIRNNNMWEIFILHY